MILYTVELKWKKDTISVQSITYSKIPQCDNLNASSTAKSAGGPMAAFVTETQRLHFYTPHRGCGGFKKKLWFFCDFRRELEVTREDLMLVWWQ